MLTFILEISNLINEVMINLTFLKQKNAINYSAIRQRI